MPGLRPDVDPDGLLEYSVVYTDRSLNHMSKRFQQVMRDVSATLKEVYGARSAVIVPISGTVTWKNAPVQNGLITIEPAWLKSTVMGPSLALTSSTALFTSSARETSA